MSEQHCVFEYMYRDAGNWKTHGALLLLGEARNVRHELRKCLEPGDLFVAEQIKVPSLCEEHFATTGDGPSDMDHAYHQFVDLRPAGEEDRASMPVTGSLTELLTRMQSAAGRWDVRLSPNCYWD